MSDVIAKLEADPGLAYSLKTAASLCDIGYSTLRAHIKAGLVTPGKLNRIHHEELERYAKETYGPRARVGRPKGPARQPSATVCPPLGLAA